MKTTTKYLCSICEKEYTQETDAARCEALGYPESTKNIKVGDVIEFEREETASPGSAMVTYIREKGTVIHKITSFHDKLGKHWDISMCNVAARLKEDGTEEFPACERGVVEITVEGEGPKLLGPAEYAFKVGLTAALISKNTTITNKVE